MEILGSSACGVKEPRNSHSEQMKWAILAVSSLSLAAFNSRETAKTVTFPEELEIVRKVLHFWTRYSSSQCFHAISCLWYLKEKKRGLIQITTLLKSKWNMTIPLLDQFGFSWSQRALTDVGTHSARLHASLGTTLHLWLIRNSVKRKLKLLQVQKCKKNPQHSRCRDEEL